MIKSITSNSILSMPKIHIEYVNTDKLKPWGQNPRSITPEMMRSLVANIERFGIVDPFIVNQKGLVVGGHQRLEAAKKLGIKQVPIVRLKLTEREMVTLNLALNKISGDWDEQKLAPLLAELQNYPEVNLTGFSQAEIDKLIRDVMPQQLEEDEIPPTPTEPITKLGDLWVLGPHRVLCGDSTKPEDVNKLLGQDNITLIVTDPPYGVSYDPQWRVGVGGGGKQDFADGEEIQNDDNFDWIRAFQHIRGDVLYCWLAGASLKTVQGSLEAYGFTLINLIIWNKDLAPMSRGDYHHKHEPCLYMVRKGAKHNWQGDRTQNTVWDIPTIHSFARGHNREEWNLLGHGNQKPVECMSKPIENNSAVGESVFDPFLGSGTTLIAAQQLGRVCYGLEIEPRYVDVAVKRWENLTGLKAVRNAQK
jgi:DNA modification methylase